jgi:beta-glucosidase
MQGLFDKPNLNTPLKSASSPAHHAAAAEIAAAGTVLLQNKGGLLPLHPAKLMAAAAAAGASAGPTIAVIGHEALGTDEHGKVVTTTAGGGSGHVAPANLTGPLAGITARCGAGCKIVHADVTSNHDIAAAVALAKSATVVLVFVATSSAEGTDRCT